MAVVIFAYATWLCFDELDYMDCSTWGLLVFGLSIMTYSMFSSVAHLLHSRSELAHHFFFGVDYIGVGVYGYGRIFPVRNEVAAR